MLTVAHLRLGKWKSPAFAEQGKMEGLFSKVGVVMPPEAAALCDGSVSASQDI